MMCAQRCIPLGLGSRPTCVRSVRSWKSTGCAGFNRTIRWRIRWRVVARRCCIARWKTRRHPSATKEMRGSIQLIFFKNTRQSYAHELYGDMLAPAGFPKHPYLMARLGMGAGLPATWFAKYFSTEKGVRSLADARHTPSWRCICRWPLAIGVVLQMSGHAVGWPVPEGGSPAHPRMPWWVCCCAHSVVRCSVMHP